MRKMKKKVNLGILGASPYVTKGVPQSCLDYKFFECYKIHFERVWKIAKTKSLSPMLKKWYIDCDVNHGIDLFFQDEQM